MKPKESGELYQCYLDPKLQYEVTTQTGWVENIQVVAWFLSFNTQSAISFCLGDTDEISTFLTHNPPSFQKAHMQILTIKNIMYQKVA